MGDEIDVKTEVLLIIVTVAAIKTVCLAPGLDDVWETDPGSSTPTWHTRHKIIDDRYSFYSHVGEEYDYYSSDPFQY